MAAATVVYQTINDPDVRRPQSFIQSRYMKRLPRLTKVLIEMWLKTGFKKTNEMEL